MPELNRLSPEEFRKQEKLPVVVVLDNIRSLQNIGSIFRTADAFNLEAIFLCGITATPPHREIHRTALGATESVAWEYFGTTMEAIYHLRQMKYQLIAVEQTDQSIPLSEFTASREQPIALVFGNEVHGISTDILPMLNQAVEIPQFGTKHSLNVAVTAGIVIWEIVRNRKKNFQIK